MTTETCSQHSRIEETCTKIFDKLDAMHKEQIDTRIMTAGMVERVNNNSNRITWLVGLGTTLGIGLALTIIRTFL